MNCTGIVIPAYKEHQNIVALLREISNELPAIRIVVVDDSPDSLTVDAVRAASLPACEVIHRSKKDGRGSAVLDGMRELLADGCEEIIEMDADFSHSPRELPRLLDEFRSKKLDLLIGSRYQPASQIKNWPIGRRVFSKCSNRLARLLLGVPVSDYTNGYRIYSRGAAEFITKNCGQFGRGFISLSEILLKLHLHGCLIGEAPTVFINRIRGESAVNFWEIQNAATGLLRLFLFRLMNND